MAEAEKKLNRYGNSHAGYYSRPINLSKFGNGRLSPSIRKLASVVCGYSLNGSSFESSYEEMGARYNLSRATVGRFVKWAMDEENPVFKRGEKVYQYQFTGEKPEKEEHFLVYEWLSFAEFEVGVNKHIIKLTTDQVEVLSYIRSFMPSGLKATRNWIAEKLTMSHDTVATAVKVLEAVGAIEVTEPEGGAVNGTTRTLFKSKENFLKKKRKETVRHEKPKSKEELEAERVRYYEGKEKAEADRLEELDDYLRQDSAYAEAVDAIKKAEIDIEVAKHNHNVSELTRLLEYRQKMKEQKLERMQLMEISEEEFERKYTCEECHDTGERIADNTYCDCWRRRPR